MANNKATGLYTHPDPISEEWAAYDLYEFPIISKSDDLKTDFKAIFKDGKPVTITKTRYKLLPNELVVQAANLAANKTGLIPFDSHKGDWVGGNKTDKHIFHTGHKVHAIYAHPTEYTVNGDKMYIGAAIHNSIDSTMGFTGGVFSFRAACKNVVLSAGWRDWAYWYSNRDHGRTIESLYKRHTTHSIGEIIDNLEGVMIQIMERADEIVKSYNLLAKIEANAELYDRLGKSALPRRVLPEHITDEATPHPHGLSLWDVYNDLTAEIWHDKKTNTYTKIGQFSTLHKVIGAEIPANR